MTNNSSAEKYQLFQYAVILHKTETRGEKTEYVGAEIVKSPTWITARSEKEVMFTAIREVPADKAENPEMVEIKITPF